MIFRSSEICRLTSKVAVLVGKMMIHYFKTDPYNEEDLKVYLLVSMKYRTLFNQMGLILNRNIIVLTWVFTNTRDIINGTIHFRLLVSNNITYFFWYHTWAPMAFSREGLKLKVQSWIGVSWKRRICNAKIGHVMGKWING